jgi:hypothetical protein
MSVTKTKTALLHVRTAKLRHCCRKRHCDWRKGCSLAKLYYNEGIASRLKLVERKNKPHTIVVKVKCLPSIEFYVLLYCYVVKIHVNQVSTTLQTNLDTKTRCKETTRVKFKVATTHSSNP